MSTRFTRLALAPVLLVLIAAAPATQPDSHSLSIGSPERDVKKLKPKIISPAEASTDSQGTRHVRTTYELADPAGARVVCEKGKVTYLSREPVIGMGEAEFLRWNQTLYAPLEGILMKEPMPLWTLKAESVRTRVYVQWQGGDEYRRLTVDVDTKKIAYLDK